MYGVEDDSINEFLINEDNMGIKVNRFFCIVIEGVISDGCVIDCNMFVQMVKNYDLKMYFVCINMEYICGYLLVGLFKVYGDVVVLKVEEYDGKMGLYVQFDFIDELIVFIKVCQKIFLLMEVQLSFVDIKEVYLVGLVVIDNFVSLGCEVLQFSVIVKVNLFVVCK